MQDGHQRDQRGEQHRPQLEAPDVPRTRRRVGQLHHEVRQGVGGEVPQRRAQRVGDQDGQPVEDLVPARGDLVGPDRPGGQLPGDQHRHHRRQQDRRGQRIAEVQAAVEEVRGGGPHRRGRHHQEPVGEGVIAMRLELQTQRHDEIAEEDQGRGQVAQLQGHRQGVAAGLAHGGGADLHQPEHQRGLGRLAQRLVEKIGLRGVGHRLLPCAAIPARPRPCRAVPQ